MASLHGEPGQAMFSGFCPDREFVPLGGFRPAPVA
jgi:hypothetical protein